MKLEKRNNTTNNDYREVEFNHELTVRENIERHAEANCSYDESYHVEGIDYNKLTMDITVTYMSGADADDCIDYYRLNVIEE